MRLDKYLCEMNIGSRSQVKELIRKKMVCVNDIIITKPELQIREASDLVTVKGQAVQYEKYVYYMMNKPVDVVCATVDSLSKTVIELMDVPGKDKLFPVGRLDKDTTGLLLLTNDGELSHRLLSPKKHVDKTYLVECISPLSDAAVLALETGVSIEENELTAPARVKRIDDKHFYLTLQEGKYHQVKRMLFAVGNQVVTLKRVEFGGLYLDETLNPGEYRALTESERKLLQNGK